MIFLWFWNNRNMYVLCLNNCIIAFSLCKCKLMFCAKISCWVLVCGIFIVDTLEILQSFTKLTIFPLSMSTKQYFYCLCPRAMVYLSATQWFSASLCISVVNTLEILQSCSTPCIVPLISRCLLSQTIFRWVTSELRHLPFIHPWHVVLWDKKWINRSCISCCKG